MPRPDSGASSRVTWKVRRATRCTASGSHARSTRLTNVGEGWLAGRLQDGIGGMAAEEPLSSLLPAQKTFDMRIARGWNIRGMNAQVVADLRNPVRSGSAMAAAVSNSGSKCSSD